MSEENTHTSETPAENTPIIAIPEITFFAQTNFRNENRRFGIKRDDRRRHVYVIGKTGMGKSTMLENMIIQDIQNGEGLAVVDPHGDLVEKVVQFIPSHRINDVVYFNPSDTDNPIAFNILENVSAEYKHLVSNGLVGVFKKIWADSWGPRLEYILINTILALLEYPGSTLLGVTRMLVDAKYRKKIVRSITDPVVKSFWTNEYNNYTEKFRNEAIAPIQNKVGQFLSSSLIRNIVGQTKSTINMREIMDSGKILLMNLAKGRIGEENAALLGAMMITKMQLAAMSRVDTPEAQRKDFWLYVDEFQNFSTESFANILSEARKYRLGLIMAHQYIEQLSDEVRAAVFGNVGTMIAFRVGATDAEEFEKEFQPVFLGEDIVTLPAHHVYLRLMIDGVTSEPFSATTLPPISGQTDNREKVVAVSRERYARSREVVEEKIRKWAGMIIGSDTSDTEDFDESEDAGDDPLPPQAAVIAEEKPVEIDPSLQIPTTIPEAVSPVIQTHHHDDGKINLLRNMSTQTFTDAVPLPPQKAEEAAPQKTFDSLLDALQALPTTDTEPASVKRGPRPAAPAVAQPQQRPQHNAQTQVQAGALSAFSGDKKKRKRKRNRKRSGSGGAAGGGQNIPSSNGSSQSRSSSQRPPQPTHDRERGPGVQSQPVSRPATTLDLPKPTPQAKPLPQAQPAPFAPKPVQPLQPGQPIHF